MSARSRAIHYSDPFGGVPIRLPFALDHVLLRPWRAGRFLLLCDFYYGAVDPAVAHSVRAQKMVSGIDARRSVFLCIYSFDGTANTADHPLTITFDRRRTVL